MDGEAIESELTTLVGRSCFPNAHGKYWRYAFREFVAMKWYATPDGLTGLDWFELDLGESGFNWMPQVI